MTAKPPNNGMNPTCSSLRSSQAGYAHRSAASPASRQMGAPMDETDSRVTLSLVAFYKQEGEHAPTDCCTLPT